MEAANKLLKATTLDRAFKPVLQFLAFADRSKSFRNGNDAGFLKKIQPISVSV